MTNAPAPAIDGFPRLFPQQEKPESEHARLRRTKPFRFWHATIIDDMIAFPLSTIKERAARVGYSQSSLELIMSSDMFKAAYSERRRRYEDVLHQAIKEKAAGVALTGLEIMQQQMEKKRDSLPFAAVATSVVEVLEMLGFGAKAAPGVQLNVQSNGGSVMVAVPVSAEQLGKARDKLRAVESQKLEQPIALSSASSAVLEGEVLPPVKAAEVPEG